jgi:hypothetical protein
MCGDPSRVATAWDISSRASQREEEEARTKINPVPLLRQAVARLMNLSRVFILFIFYLLSF